ncbi:MAG: diguanylate cyclase, partial [Candidatus Izemoplasmataceae bacterium]
PSILLKNVLVSIGVLCAKFEINFFAKTFDGDEYVKRIFEQDQLDFESYRMFFRDSIHPDDKDDIYHKNSLLMNGKIKEGSSLLRLIMPNSGDIKYIEYYLQTIEKDAFNKPVKILGLVRDVTETQNARNQIDYLASHDQLSGVYNRHHLYQNVNKKAFDYPVKLAILDLDGLKTVNDVFGHYEGDRVIKRFSKILREVYYDQYIARVGGDEFVIIFTNGIKNPKTREKLVREQLKKILDINIPLDVSIGYHDLKDKHTNFHEAFTRAEEEMYRHKLLARPKRKERILKVLVQYMFNKDDGLKDRIERLEKYATSLMKQHGYMRKDEEQFLKQAIYYHAIGQVMDFVHDVKHTDKSKRYEILNVEAGFKILLNLLEKEVVCKTVLYQCEQYNGRGYPHRLKGKDIPFLSRVLAIVYHYDDLINHQSYEKNDALDDLIKNSPRLFDPNLVQTFVYVINKL